LLETLPTKDRPALCGLEGNGGFLATLRAISPGFYLGIVSGCRGTHVGGPLGLASFAAFGFVLELFVVEEKLFSRCEDEVGAAVNTLKNLVLKFHGELLPSARDSQVHRGGELPPAGETGLNVSTWWSLIPVLRYIFLGSARHA
jgi:hypothetical protein